MPLVGAIALRRAGHAAGHHARHHAGALRVAAVVPVVVPVVIAMPLVVVPAAVSVARRRAVTRIVALRIGRARPATSAAMTSACRTFMAFAPDRRGGSSPGSLRPRIPCRAWRRWCDPVAREPTDRRAVAPCEVAMQPDHAVAEVVLGLDGAAALHLARVRRRQHLRGRGIEVGAEQAKHRPPPRPSAPARPAPATKIIRSLPKS